MRWAPSESEIRRERNPYAKLFLAARRIKAYEGAGRRTPKERPVGMVGFRGPHSSTIMSEYQYYEFQALDRPLNAR